MIRSAIVAVVLFASVSEASAQNVLWLRMPRFTTRYGEDLIWMPEVGHGFGGHFVRATTANRNLLLNITTGDSPMRMTRSIEQEIRCGTKIAAALRDAERQQQIAEARYARWLADQQYRAISAAIQRDRAWTERRQAEALEAIAWSLQRYR